MKHAVKIFLLSGAMAIASSNAMAACMTARESAAERVRILQLELMVAALQCRNVQGSRLPELYNDVVTLHRTSFSKAAQLLDAHFRRVNPQNYLRAADAQATQISNRMSTFGRSTQDFCGRSEAVAGGLLSTATAEELVQVAETLPEIVNMASPVCKGSPEKAR